MEHRYNLENLLLSTLHLKARVYTGMWLSRGRTGMATGGDYADMGRTDQPAEYTEGGCPLRKVDQWGRYYLMPVTLGGIEMPCAVISVTGSKTIIETPMAGRRGTVKELISVDDYHINLSGVLVAEDYPSALIEQMHNLYKRNESVEIISALTDLLLEDNDKVVIKSIEYPPVGAVENAQVVKMQLVTDAPFDLKIK